MAYVLLVVIGALIPGGCRHIPSGSRVSSGPVSVKFVDITDRAGISFQHNNGARGKKYMPETVGSGVAFLDYDNDGRQDILLINSTDWPGVPHGRSTLKLYHNNHDGTFTDVTHAAGLDLEFYGMGVAVGDFDNDGWEDIYVTALGTNHLFHNELGMKGGLIAGGNVQGALFKDVTREAGVEGVPAPGTELRWKWSTSAAWLDYDRDGKLDLFVCNYVKWSPEKDVSCGEPGHKSYCPPNSYEGVNCTLYHNEGNGRFRDVSEAMGIRSAKTIGKSFGVAVADFNGDGWPDIAVSNDTWPNFLFINDKGKRFVERGVEAGMAFAESGASKAGMGIDTADWKNTGSFGLLIGNFAGESLSLFENDGQGVFIDRSHATGMGAASLLSLTFGLFFIDYDLDGSLDAITANGHIDDLVKTTNSMLSYRERPQLFHNDGSGHFVETGLQCGLSGEIVGRGAAFADIDNDGDLDVLLMSNGGKPLLLRNDGGNRNQWIRFRTVGVRSNRDGIGALVRVTVDGKTQSQYVRSGTGFLSESQRQKTFGLGGSPVAATVEVLWPSGARDAYHAVRAGSVYVLTEGGGIAPESRGH